MTFIQRAAAIASVALCVAVVAATSAANADAPSAYIGAQACAGCHAAQAASWGRSHHALAMQPTTAQTVLGDFNAATFEHDGATTTTFFRDGDTFQVRTEGPDGALHTYPVAYTFGVAPLQQYLIGFPGGRYQALGIAWDSRPKEQGGQRWFSLYPGQTVRPGDPLHWTGRDQTWNYQCAFCHSTNLRKNFDLAANTYATTWTDVNVGCESCHGPGSRHLAWAKAPLTGDPSKGLVAWLKATDGGQWQMNAATGIALRTQPLASAELDTCAACHARRHELTGAPVPGASFLDNFEPALLEPGLYHADGQIDGEVYEYGSFLQSRMHAAGVTCTNCHEPHSLQLRAPGNQVCAQCHLPAKFDAASHHHHQPGNTGAQCVACHMPTSTYMVVDARRDHSIRVPRPDLSDKLGTPNACTQCHTDKTAAWAAQAVDGWFPGGRQTTPHYGLALHAGRTGSPDAEPLLDALIADAGQPAIARASALLLLPRLATQASVPAWRSALADPEPLVRLGAARGLPASPTAGMVRLAAPLLSDPVRAVRIEAARALAGAAPDSLTSEQRSALAAATLELVAAETTASDRPETHLNLGLLALRQDHPDQADAEYRTALRLDPRFVPAMVNLADLDRARGLDDQGTALLRQAVALEPDNADAHHALGLLLVRQHQYPEARAELRRATELAPANPRYAYVYAIALSSGGDTDKALAVLRRAHEAAPLDRDVLLGLVSLSRDQGDVAAALRYATELARLYPNDVPLALLIRELERQQGR
jgi:predicted CXXCH cytochrome family protein